MKIKLTGGRGGGGNNLNLVKMIKSIFSVSENLSQKYNQ